MTDFKKCVITWDDKIRRETNNLYDVRIRTGMSTMINSRITNLKRRNAAQGVIVENKMWKVLHRISSEQLHQRYRAGWPDIRLYDIKHDLGIFTFATVHGIVLNGSWSEGLLQGDFLFVVVTDDELDDCIYSVFEMRDKLVEVSR